MDGCITTGYWVPISAFWRHIVPLCMFATHATYPQTCTYAHAHRLQQVGNVTPSNPSFLHLYFFVLLVFFSFSFFALLFAHGPRQSFNSFTFFIPNQPIALLLLIAWSVRPFFFVLLFSCFFRFLNQLDTTSLFFLLPFCVRSSVFPIAFFCFFAFLRVHIPSFPHLSLCLFIHNTPTTPPNPLPLITFIPLS